MVHLLSRTRPLLHSLQSSPICKGGPCNLSSACLDLFTIIPGMNGDSRKCLKQGPKHFVSKSRRSRLLSPRQAGTTFSFPGNGFPSPTSVPLSPKSCYLSLRFNGTASLALQPLPSPLLLALRLVPLAFLFFFIGPFLLRISVSLFVANTWPPKKQKNDLLSLPFAGARTTPPPPPPKIEDGTRFQEMNFMKCLVSQRLRF